MLNSRQLDKNMNTWESLNDHTRIKESAGLEDFTILLPSSAIFQQLISGLEDDSDEKHGPGEYLASDPDGITIILRACQIQFYLTT